MNNALTWFEIPARDLDRAAQFYGTVPNDMGHYAHIVDSEGNRVGVHAVN